MGCGALLIIAQKLHLSVTIGANASAGAFEAFCLKKSQTPKSNPYPTRKKEDMAVVFFTSVL